LPLSQLAITDKLSAPMLVMNKDDILPTFDAQN
jgi:hypothetical protein